MEYLRLLRQMAMMLAVAAIVLAVMNLATVMSQGVYDRGFGDGVASTRSQQVANSPDKAQNKPSVSGESSLMMAGMSDEPTVTNSLKPSAVGKKAEIISGLLPDYEGLYQPSFSNGWIDCDDLYAQSDLLVDKHGLGLRAYRPLVHNGHIGFANQLLGANAIKALAYCYAAPAQVYLVRLEPAEQQDLRPYGISDSMKSRYSYGYVCSEDRRTWIKPTSVITVPQANWVSEQKQEVKIVRFDGVPRGHYVMRLYDGSGNLVKECTYEIEEEIAENNSAA